MTDLSLNDFYGKNDETLHQALSATLGAVRTETVICLDAVGSTNDVLKELACKGAKPGTVVLAAYQSAGKGRLGRSFLSPKGEGVYLSMLFKPSGDFAAWPQITAWASVAVCRAVKKACAVDLKIKWVNDLMLNGRKLGGILTEATQTTSAAQHSVIIGIGLNLTQKAFPEELSGKAGSLFLETGKSFAVNAVASELISALDDLALCFPGKKTEYLRAYRESCVTCASEVSFNYQGLERHGIALGVDDDFGLIVKLEDGETLVLRTGEVSVRGKDSYI